MNLIEDLTWRGLIADSTSLENLNDFLSTESRYVYAGFDPTGDSLHAGHLVPLITLKRFLKYGHKPILLAGGGTAQIGDPREVGERKAQDSSIIEQNTKKIISQLENLFKNEKLEISKDIVFENNINWLNELTLINFLRDVGKYFSVNVMLSKDLIKKRLSNDGISFSEFTYSLLQANDYFELYSKYNCQIQIGGSDQWGNLVSGLDFIRKKTSKNLHAFTVPLVTNEDGTKFGKTTGGGNLWLDSKKTSPYSWYQYFLNIRDADVIRFLKWFTFLNKEEIDILEQSLISNPHLREAQKELAKEMTLLLYDKNTLDSVINASEAFFGKSNFDNISLEVLLSALKEINLVEVNASDFNLVEILVKLELFKSKSMTRKTIEEGGVYINNKKINSVNWLPQKEDWIHNKILVIRKGKKSFAGIELNNA